MAVDEQHVRKPPGGRSVAGLGLVKGLGVTMKHFLHRTVTQRYPEERPVLPARTRGVIALKQENCTVCYKCARECPDWCIYIDAHKETHEPAAGGRGRSAKILDRFAIDFSLCMFCGICVEVCPFDALFWSPEFEYAAYDIVEMTHEKERLEEWTYTVLPPPAMEDGATLPPVTLDLAALAAVPAAPSAPPAPEAAAPSTPPSPAAAAPAATAPPAQPAATTGVPDAAAPGTTSPSTDAVGAASGAPGGVAGPEAAAPATAPAAPRERKEVPLDQETFDRVLAELLDKGTPQRVAEGQARRAAMIAARKKAEGQA